MKSPKRTRNTLMMLPRNCWWNKLLPLRQNLNLKPIVKAKVFLIYRVKLSQKPVLSSLSLLGKSSFDIFRHAPKLWAKNTKKSLIFIRNLMKPLLTIFKEKLFPMSIRIRRKSKFYVWTLSKRKKPVLWAISSWTIALS